MTPAELAIAEAERETNEALRRVYAKTHFTPSDDKTPLDELLASEQAPKCPHCKGEIEAHADLEHWMIRNETARRLFEYFCQDGLELHNVIRNVYAVGAHMGLPPWSELTVRERGLICDESHGSAHLVMLKNVNKLRRGGARSFKAPGQKSIESGSSYSDAQKGNTNRKRRKLRSRHKRLRARRKLN
jgi:hypothetical protein